MIAFFLFIILSIEPVNSYLDKSANTKVLVLLLKAFIMFGVLYIINMILVNFTGYNIYKLKSEPDIKM